jgi:hypothetical protein
MEKKGWKIIAIILFILFLIMSLLNIRLYGNLVYYTEVSFEQSCRADCVLLNYGLFEIKEDNYCYCSNPLLEDLPKKVFIDGQRNVRPI